MKTFRIACAAIGAASFLIAAPAFAQGASAPIKVGLMLPYSGTYAGLGNAIENGFKLYVQEQGGKLAGREIQYFKVDDESEPSKGTDNVNKLIKRDNVDVLVGTVHSGVALAMRKRRRTATPCSSSRTPAPTRSPVRCVLPTSSAARSRTGNPATRWASSRRRRASSGR